MIGLPSLISRSTPPGIGVLFVFCLVFGRVVVATVRKEPFFREPRARESFKIICLSELQSVRVLSLCFRVCVLTPIIFRAQALQQQLSAVNAHKQSQKKKDAKDKTPRPVEQDNDGWTDVKKKK